MIIKSLVILNLVPLKILDFITHIRPNLDRRVEFKVLYESFTDSYGKLAFMKFSMLYQDRYGNWKNVFYDNSKNNYWRLSLRDAVYGSMYFCGNACRITVSEYVFRAVEPDHGFEVKFYNYEWFSFMTGLIQLGVESNKTHIDRNVIVRIEFDSPDNYLEFSWKYFGTYFIEIFEGKSYSDQRIIFKRFLELANRS